MPSPGTDGLDETGGDGGSAGTFAASGSVGVSGTFGSAGTGAASHGGTVGASGSGSGAAGHAGTGGSSAGGSASNGGTGGSSMAGAGGMASVGGGTGTLGCTHLQPGGSLGLQVQYKAEDASASVAYIYFDIEIDNLDDSPVALADLHYRYYFNDDLTTPVTDFYAPLVKHVNGNTENLGANDLKATYMPTYLEVTFSSALSILKGENVAFKVHLHSDPTPGMHTQAGDYSFSAGGSLAPSCKEILYQQTALAWGTPPA